MKRKTGYKRPDMTQERFDKIKALLNAGVSKSTVSEVMGSSTRTTGLIEKASTLLEYCELRDAKVQKIEIQSDGPMEFKELAARIHELNSAVESAIAHLIHIDNLMLRKSDVRKKFLLDDK